MTAAVAEVFTQYISKGPGLATPSGNYKLPTYVHPGQIVITNEAGMLTTILGSCVAVCLHDPRLRMGGLNHYLLPNTCSPDQATGRYAPSAIAQLVDGMLSSGASPSRMIAHVVGGAAVLAAFNSSAAQLGARNAEIARDMLRHYKIPVVSTDIGGSKGRKLLFSPRDGSISVQIIGK